MESMRVAYAPVRIKYPMLIHSTKNDDEQSWGLAANYYIICFRVVSVNQQLQLFFCNHTHSVDRHVLTTD